MVLETSLPPTWIGEWVQPHPVSPPDHPIELIAQAIAQPIASPGLEMLARPGQKVVLIVDDQTRHTPASLVLPLLVERLSQAGVADDNICIVIALGTHRLMTQAELEAKLGAEVCARFPVVQSACDDTTDKLYLGLAANGIPAWVQQAVVESDLRIGVGMITPHMDAGFSGGAKIILPGVCGEQTIDAFHVRAADSPENPLGNPQAPLRLALERFVQEHTPLDFIVNLVLTPDEQVYQCVAGDPIAAHRQGVEYARQVYGVPAQHRYPVVVAECAPYQHDLWQSCKGLWCGDLLTSDDGTLIWATQAPEGSRGYPRLAAHIGMPPEALKARLEAGLEEDLKSAATGLMIGRMKQRIRIVLVSQGLTQAEAGRMGLAYFPTIEAAVEEVVMRLPADQRFASVAIIPQAGVALPILL